MQLTIGFRRAEIAAFWVLGSAVLSGALWATSTMLGARAPLVWAASGLLIVLPGVAAPRWFELGVRAWNRAVRLSAAAIRAYVLRVCYYVVFSAVGSMGSSLDLRATGRQASRWIKRTGATPSFSGGPSHNDASAQELLALFRRPNPAWGVCVLPFLWLLMLVQEEPQESAPPSSTYTLY